MGRGSLLGAGTAALLLGALAGCAGEPERIVLAPPEAAPPAGVDGRYRGTARLVRAAIPTCPRSGSRVYQVQNGQVTLAYTPSGRARVQLTADIGADGRFSASDGVGTMEGTLTDGRLEISIASSACEHRWTLTRAS